jgi:hypothetical protein
MVTDFTRREFAKLAGTGALMMSASSAAGTSASAAGAATGNAKVAQAALQLQVKDKAARVSFRSDGRLKEASHEIL